MQFVQDSHLEAHQVFADGRWLDGKHSAPIGHDIDVVHRDRSTHDGFSSIRSEPTTHQSSPVRLTERNRGQENSRDAELQSPR